MPCHAMMTAAPQSKHTGSRSRQANRQQVIATITRLPLLGGKLLLCNQWHLTDRQSRVLQVADQAW